MQYYPGNQGYRGIPGAVLNLDELSEQSSEDLVKMAENALKRSATALLTVYLVLLLSTERDDRECLDRVLAVIVRHSQRWKDVTILAEESVIFSLSQIHGNLPSLNKLRLHYLTNTGRVFSGLEIAPRLRDVTLENLGLPRYLPLPQFTSLSFVGSDFHDVPPEDLYSVFQNASGLEEFHWSKSPFPVRYETEWDTTPDTPLILSRLRVLDLCISDAGLFNRITLPALKKLEWKTFLQFPHCDGLEHDESYPALRRLITRSNGLQSLRTVVLNLTTLRPQIYGLLDDIPGVAELHIVNDINRASYEGERFIVPLFNALSYGRGSLPILSRLETFKINAWVKIICETSEAGITMVKSGWRAGTDLGSCKLSAVELSCIFLSEKFRKCLMDMRSEGLSVSGRSI
ncbi:uncharacterized protein BT62DRAFT_303597 [Guyanagaster necrorhizus]|uniref:Uncharacterized protein n=1 Tax=Guyanagaster necrorhizus TaxID=856835 RepID=A0A9P8ARI1_9AGAR|nr:uncharacterized protein BT62DRAFT_303597 [Guyanagaster necrorhizus MCA 3950]KAG7443887.1 hypothetical protein BT62DRAFT_303597 [Guyanagaster necrorhizus MCA 3950]